MKRIQKLFITILWLFLSTSASYAQTLNEATLFPDFNQTNRIDYDTANGDHWWKFDATANERLTIVLTAHINRGSMIFHFYDVNKKLIKPPLYYQGISGGETKVLDFSAIVTGTYYLKVTGFTKGSYDLSLYSAWQNPGVVDRDRGFYHSLNTARYLMDATYSRTTLISSQKVLLTDYYRFTAEADNRVDIELTGNLSSGQVYVSILDVNGTEIAKTRSPGIRGDETKVLSELIHTDGVYYLAVSGNGVGNYNLSVSGARHDADSDNDGLNDAVEYNHQINPNSQDTDGDGSGDYIELSRGESPLSSESYFNKQIPKTQNIALEIPYRNKVFNAEYKSENGDHWWKFDAISGEGLTIAMTSFFNAGSMRFHLYDADNKLIKSSSYFQGMSEGRTEWFDISAATTGTYYLKVTGSSVGNYYLAFYSAWHNAGISDGDRDFYHSFNTARYLIDATYSRASLLSSQQVPLTDYYRFTAEAGKRINIELTGSFNSGSVYVSIFDVDGTEITKTAYPGVRDGETKILSETINANGTYFLSVSGKGIGHYSLSAEGAAEDTDRDGIPDNKDNCLLDSNVNQIDADADGFGNICDLDDDGDGLPDTWELEFGLDPLNAADASLDSDDDGISNLDEYLANTDPTQIADADRDGIPDSKDNCPLESNPNQTDVDADGFGNICDLDDDGDGLPDTWEIEFGLDPLNAADASLDSDDDGISNLDEYLASTHPTQTADEAQSIFVERFYLEILNRTAEPEELAGWLTEIQTSSGSKLALSFFNSQEFINLQLDNSDFVNILYSTLFDRLADQDGFDAWMEKLESGVLREMVIYGFLRSPEFTNLSTSFGVIAFSEEDNTLFQIKSFIERFYQLVLNREPDKAGFDDWSAQLADPEGTKTGGDIARNFFLSPEFIDRGLTDNEFLDIAYQSFFDREADEEGKQEWLDEMSLGTTREQVVSGFIESQEFTNLANRFGIRAN